MAVINSIPPQAYTRDVLVKAIEWMQHQPPSLREKATTADLMVSFYMSACRRNAASNLEAPVSQENFKADLKHLAEGLRQFESAPPPPPAGRFSPYGRARAEIAEKVEPPRAAHRAPNLNKVEPLFAPVDEAETMGAGQEIAQAAPGTSGPYHYIPGVTQGNHPHMQAGHVDDGTVRNGHAQSLHATPASDATTQWSPDARSLAAARALQQRLNLGSEGEALRLLITLGSEVARELFP